MTHGEGLVLVLLPDQADAGMNKELRLAPTFSGRCYLSLNRRIWRRFAAAAQLARSRSRTFRIVICRADPGWQLARVPA